LDEVTGTELESEIPSHTLNDDLLVKVPSLEQILCRGRFRHPGSYRRIPGLSTVCTRTPTSVQKSYFLLGAKERDVLNQALSKYRPGQSEPILIGGEKLLKPVLKLMSFYRGGIDEIKEDAVVTSYTRWLEAVIVKGTENQVSGG
jgi:hypothetical protein